MEHKHTAEPWAYQPGQTDGHWNIGLPNDIPECIGLRGDEYMCVSGICTESDARLIAAAPDLLEALDQLLIVMAIAQENMREAAKYDLRWRGCAESIQPCVDAARAAIAKATGTQP